MNPVLYLCERNLFDILGVKILTRLRVKFSSLNEHRFRQKLNVYVQHAYVEQLGKTLNITSYTADSSVLCGKLSLAKYQTLVLI